MANADNHLTIPRTAGYGSPIFRSSCVRPALGSFEILAYVTYYHPLAPVLIAKNSDGGNENAEHENRDVIVFTVYRYDGRKLTVFRVSENRYAVVTET